VTSTVQGPLYQTLLGLLGTKSMRLSELIAATELKGTPPADLARAVDAGVAMGLFDVTAGPVPSGPDTVTGKIGLANLFNTVLLQSDSLGGRAIALASETTGTGHTLGDFDAAILHELVERGREGLAGRVETRLAGSGRSLQQNGQPVTDPATRAKLVADACNAFLTGSLPQLAKLGIVTTT
jgi:hypothetical protein